MFKFYNNRLPEKLKRLFVKKVKYIHITFDMQMNVMGHLELQNWHSFLYHFKVQTYAAKISRDRAAWGGGGEGGCSW